MTVTSSSPIGMSVRRRGAVAEPAAVSRSLTGPSGRNSAVTSDGRSRRRSCASAIVDGDERGEQVAHGAGATLAVQVHTTSTARGCRRGWTPSLSN